jgi:uncharacterized protein DUF6602
MEKDPKTLDLRKAFLSLQAQMVSSLSATREVVSHPSTQGAATELQWLTMLNNYLPERYWVDSAFVLDSDGTLSEQIDVVIYDRQYSPFWFNQNFVKYVPAESVYAVLEVKPEIDADVLKYAGQKVASVRRLRRTSVPIPWVDGHLAAKPPGAIWGGVLALKSRWTPPLGKPFADGVCLLADDERIDLGCVLQGGAFSVTYAADQTPSIITSSPETSLIRFFLDLVSRLRALGTVPALDLSQYGRVL